MYKYSGYSIRFNRKGKFSLGYRFGRNCIILRVDISSSIRVDNKNKDILFFGKGPTQDTRIRWQNINCRKKYSINFNENNKKCF